MSKSLLSFKCTYLCMYIHNCCIQMKIILFPFTSNGGHKCTKQNSKSQCNVEFTTYSVLFGNKEPFTESRYVLTLGVKV